MNPFRKKAVTSPELLEITVSAPPADPKVSVLTDIGIPADLDLWADTPISPAPPTAFPTSSSPPPPKITPKSPPPPVIPRRRRSQIGPKKYPIPETPPEPPTLADPFNPNPEASSESDAEPEAPTIWKDPRISPANPFTRSQPISGDLRRSLDLTDRGNTSEAPGPKPGRQSLDAEAFKRLMLTGQSSPLVIAPDSNSTDTSSVSRQSIFEPILETDSAKTETPRTSHEIEDSEELQQVRATKTKDRSGSSGSIVRPKPPPPKPRTRGGGGGKSPISPSVSGSPPPPPGRPSSIYSLQQLEKPLPPPPPPPPSQQLFSPSSPPSPAPSLHKRIAPSPPLSRRQSTHSKPHSPEQHPSTPKMKPPPPPIRRMKSTSARPAGLERPQSLSITTVLPPPPPPPPGRSRSSTAGSLEPTSGGAVEARSPLGLTPVGREERGCEELDILVDLQKLQREVDELRGKYEGRGVGVGVGE